MRTHNFCSLAMAAALALVSIACSDDPSSDLCAVAACGDHGRCEPSDGVCRCDEGYRGPECETCQTGWHAEDGLCVADACTEDSDCGDGLACSGAERCEAGACVAAAPVSCGAHATCEEPSGDCVCDAGYHREAGVCLADECQVDADCDDGAACTGEERCVEQVCRAGVATSCGDNASCVEPEAVCACDEGSVEVEGACVHALSIAGDYVEADGTEHRIRQTSWIRGATRLRVGAVDNQARYVLLEGPEGSWSRVDWMLGAAGAPLVCGIVTGAPSAAAAEAATGADRADRFGGCAGEAWTLLLEPLPIAGVYQDDTGATHTIGSHDWAVDEARFRIERVYAEGFLLAENHASNAEFPGRWSRWHWLRTDTELRVCRLVSDAADVPSALQTSPPDEADLETGCRGGAWLRLAQPLDVAGDWYEPGGLHHHIEAGVWTVMPAMGAATRHTIVSADNPAGVVIARTEGGAWVRLEWVRFDGALYFCSVLSDGASEAEARAASANRSQPLDGGCGGEAWTRLNPPLAIAGNYTDNYGITHEVSQVDWFQSIMGFPEYDTHFDITWIDNQGMWLVAQNRPSNPWSGGEWSRYDWSFDGSGALWYCQIAFTAATEAEARMTARPEDRDPAQGGCGGSPWSRLDP